MPSTSVVNEEEVPTDAAIIKNFSQAGHPTAFSSPGTVYKYYEGKIPLERIQRLLQHIDSYTLHKEYKKPRYHNPYYVYLSRHHFQADLIDIAALRTANDDVTFLLVILDVFSRKMWVKPVLRKSALHMENAFKEWLNEINAPGCLSENAYILVDSGLEFSNRRVKELLSKVGLRLEQAKNIHKASIVERANKSLQVLIYKYLTDKGETRYLDVLKDLVSSYNNRPHRSLANMTPNEADQAENAPTVRSIHLERYQRVADKRPKKTRYQVGDKVRVKTFAKAPSSARRAYLQQYKGEMFEIVRISRRMPMPFYYIKSMNDGEMIEGGFYANELSLLQGDLFKIEKIIKTVGTGVRKKHLVRWKYFDPRWDSWVLDKDVQTN